MARIRKPPVSGASRPKARRTLFVRAAVVLALAVGLGGAWLTYRAGAPGSDLRWAAAALTAPALALTDPRRVLASGDDWLNTRPLAAKDLRGKVILVNFWTYSCINSLRPLPYVRAWADKYRDRGLVVIGVHTPEFGFEKDVANVRRALSDLGVGYPVVLDSDYRIWNAFGNNAWPAFYFIGADGHVRRQALGEGNYDKSERLIQTLLAEARRAPVTDAILPVAGVGPQAAPDWKDVQSEETYVGAAKAAGFASPGGLKPDVATLYRPAAHLQLNRWSLGGSWNVGGEFATLAGPTGAIAYRFHARDLNLVMAPPPGGRTVRFRVRVDGADPGPNHGFDTDAQGWGRIEQPRMYQLVRQAGAVADRTFEIEFFDAGARAYVFTFG
jgi:thiol-disulfide isomerase/thioredoxin